MIGNVVAYVPCVSCERKEMCSMCELSFRRNQREWIAVEERLPKRLTHILVCDIYGTVGEAFFYKEDHFEWVADETLLEATHWMPLPQPPKMKGDEGK